MVRCADVICKFISHKSDIARFCKCREALIEGAVLWEGLEKSERPPGSEPHPLCQ